MFREKYQEYKQWAEDDTIAHPFKEMLKSGKIWTDVYFPEELIDFFRHEAMANGEEDVKMYISEQLLKLIHLSLEYADEHSVNLNQLRVCNLAEMEKGSY